MERNRKKVKLTKDYPDLELFIGDELSVMFEVTNMNDIDMLVCKTKNNVTVVVEKSHTDSIEEECLTLY